MSYAPYLCRVMQTKNNVHGKILMKTTVDNTDTKLRFKIVENIFHLHSYQVSDIRK